MDLAPPLAASHPGHKATTTSTTAMVWSLRCTWTLCSDYTTTTVINFTICECLIWGTVVRSPSHEYCDCVHLHSAVWVEEKQSADWKWVVNPIIHGSSYSIHHLWCQACWCFDVTMGKMLLHTPQNTYSYNVFINWVLPINKLTWRQCVCSFDTWCCCCNSDWNLLDGNNRVFYPVSHQKACEDSTSVENTCCFFIVSHWLSSRTCWLNIVEYGMICSANT